MTKFTEGMSDLHRQLSLIAKYATPSARPWYLRLVIWLRKVVRR